MFLACGPDFWFQRLGTSAQATAVSGTRPFVLPQVAPPGRAAAPAPLQALPSLLGVQAAVPTQAGDPQRQVPPLSQSRDPTAAGVCRLPPAGRPARRRGEQGLSGQDRRPGFVPKNHAGAA